MERLYEYNIESVLISNIKNQQEGLFYFIPSQIVAFVGYKNKLSENYCINNGIQPIQVNNEGGVIVSGKDSLAIGLLSKNTSNKANEKFETILCEYLTSKGLIITKNHNDILVNNTYKVASYSSRRFGDILFSAFHISFNVDLDKIKALCTKPMEKIPKGLDDYGIYPFEIENLFLQNIKVWE